MRRLASSLVLLTGLLPLALAGCKQSYSPNTYASNAAQDEANVERGVIIGVRQVSISANDTLAVAAGGAAGGVAGSQTSGGPVATALGTIGGTLAGGIGGAAAAQAVGNTRGWEYIVQQDGNKLVSVTQTNKIPLSVGLHVLVIADSQQARIVPDYTVQIPAAAPAVNAGVSTAAKPAGASIGSAAIEINIGPLPTEPDTPPPPPIAAASAPASPPAPAPAAAAPAATPLPAPSTSGGTSTPGAATAGGSDTGTSSSGSSAISVQGAPAGPRPASAP